MKAGLSSVSGWLLQLAALRLCSVVCSKGFLASRDGALHMQSEMRVEVRSVVTQKQREEM